MADADVSGANAPGQLGAGSDVAMEETVPASVEPSQETGTPAQEELKTSTLGKPKQEINLEDMFPDDESDDEFPQHTPTSSIGDTSSAGAPSSPVYVVPKSGNQRPLADSDLVIPFPSRRQTPRSCAASTNASSPGATSSSG